MDTLRKNGISAIMDVMGRKLKAQFKYANKVGMTHVITIGEDEVRQGAYPLKDMVSGEQQEALSLETIITTLKG